MTLSAFLGALRIQRGPRVSQVRVPDHVRRGTLLRRLLSRNI